ncbi:response regulator [Massilia sp. PAMC28688]|uniref:response regulator n=1 Tax=Massilia sp. PAMC28688 TaxID=2861283 RepID=UPI001C62DA81|nr:response regulator [Massilia sp. PAMC28688]QYF93414.1 response regulator [Massilia sp. PAMC28688]
MSAISKPAGPAAGVDWRTSDFGDDAGWPHTLRLSMDILLGSPFPMLLVWGERRIVAYNSAYAELAGPHHPPAPGGRVPSVSPAPMAVAAEGFRRAAGGEALQLPRQRLTFLRANGPQQLDCDLHLTPLTDDSGAVAGVLCAVAPCAERQLAPPPVGLRVLVVEDNLDSQYLVCEMIKAFGHEADGVAHAEGALDMLAKHSYNVLFSDVSLPGMSGVDLARQALRNSPDMKVIFASGYGEAMLRHVEFPFQSLQKPYEIEQLQSSLDRIAAHGQG